MIEREIVLTLDINFEEDDLKKFGYNSKNKENIERFIKDGIKAIFFDRDLQIFDLFALRTVDFDIQVKKREKARL